MKTTRCRLMRLALSTSLTALALLTFPQRSQAADPREGSCEIKDSNASEYDPALRLTAMYWFAAPKKAHARGYCDWLCQNTQNCADMCGKDQSCRQQCQDQQNCQDWCLNTLFGGMFSDGPSGGGGEKPLRCHPKCTSCQPGSKLDPEDPTLASGSWKLCLTPTCELNDVKCSGSHGSKPARPPSNTTK